MRPPLISIVIPTRNGMDTLPAVFDALGRQVHEFEVEVVVIDTESTDGTLDLVRTRATHLLQTTAAQFNHGLTRNEAIAASSGSFVILLSQDAVPADDQWLKALVSPLRESPTLAGTFARQMPRPDAGVIARHYHAHWAGSSHVPVVARIEGVDAFESMRPLERMRRCTFDNVCSCVRRTVWEELPFAKTAIAEDLAWARQVLLAGHELAFVPDAVVIHSHARPAAYEFERTALLHYELHRLFGVRTIPTWPALARSLASTVSLHLHLKRHAAPDMPIESLARALALAVAWPLGQFVGGRRAVRGAAATRSGRV
ncbi:MAG: glycosyltransferase [Vicinamibacterales bacterium]